MNRAKFSFMAAWVGFIAGVLVCIGVYGFVQTYLFPPATLEVRGVLKVQVQPVDPTASGNPPNGYFVDSTAVERIYLEGNLLEPYVGSNVVIQGTISTVCGPDTYPCYPKLLANSVIQAPGQ